MGLKLHPTYKWLHVCEKVSEAKGGNWNGFKAHGTHTWSYLKVIF
jgi:hypothetical protein